jgi:structural maintenance of chromosome 4
VGPNGSGKSNVIDSLLFVFGYRSAKIRLKKVSELIHNSDSYPNLTYAKVSVNFEYIIDLVRQRRIAVLQLSTLQIPSRKICADFCAHMVFRVLALCALQPNGDYEVVEGSQLRISRVAHKNNTSDYYVKEGDKKERHTKKEEVTTILRERCNIDIDHNRFLILPVCIEWFDVCCAVHSSNGLLRSTDSRRWGVASCVFTS